MHATDLIDRHFDVREAIGDFMSAPTTEARVAVQRAVHSFLAAERAVLAAEPALVDGEAAEREAHLRAALEALEIATSRHDIQEAADALRHRFLRLSRVHLL